MKRSLVFILVTVMLLTMACSKDTNKDNEPSAVPTETATPEPTQEPTAVITEEPVTTPEPTEEPTDVPAPTEEPTSTPEPTDVSVTDATELYSDNYENFTGIWYLSHGEVEGDEWTADEREEYITISFYRDLTAEREREIPDSETISLSGDICYSRLESGQAHVTVNFNDEYCKYSYSLNEDGELVENLEIRYLDGTAAGATMWYTREQKWGGEGDVAIRTVPDEIQAYIDNAADNAWLVTLADPSPELSAACDAAGWELDDETDNQWVECPWNNPKELIIANSSARIVDIEIHEPRSDYDPSSEESGWQAGPFMYFAHLNPGEICRFIVDMPDEKKDATMCMYMKFEDDEFDYFLRIFKYDPEDPYVLF